MSDERVKGAWLLALTEWRDRAADELSAMERDGAVTPRLGSYLHNLTSQVVLLRRDMEALLDADMDDDGAQP